LQEENVNKESAETDKKTGGEREQPTLSSLKMSPLRKIAKKRIKNKG